jgi:hypothetical protein
MGLPFGKGCCGVPRQQKWVISDKLGLVRGLDSGRITDLGLVVWQSSLGNLHYC